MAGKTRGAKSTSKLASAIEQASRVANLVTTNHADIRNWAEQRGGVPSTVRGRTGALRIDFPNGPESRLEHIRWDEWFVVFDENRLAFLYQDKTATGKLSRFNKLVKRETIEGSGRPAGARPKTRTAGARQAA